MIQTATKPFADARRKSTSATAELLAVTSRIGSRPKQKSGVKRKAIHSEPQSVVRVSGVRYVGEYSVEAAAGYAPGQFAAGDAVSVRFDADKMFVRRNGGGELQTTIIKRIG